MLISHIFQKMFCKVVKNIFGNEVPSRVRLMGNLLDPALANSSDLDPTTRKNIESGGKRICDRTHIVTGSRHK